MASTHQLTTCPTIILEVHREWAEIALSDSNVRSPVRNVARCCEQIGYTDIWIRIMSTVCVILVSICVNSNRVSVANITPITKVNTLNE